jgi:flagellar export protein FliJ
MKRYAFRLQTVLRVRKIQEDQAKTALLLANRALAEADAERLRRWEKYESITVSNELCTATEFEAGRFRWDMAAQSAILSDHMREERALEVVDARDAWREASQKVQVLERLDDRRREEWQHDVNHEELVEVDDIVTGRFKRGDR